MDDENVLKLILSGESEQVERKEQLKNKKPEVCQAICAFANDFPRTGRPGVVVIGQRDDGAPRGLPITDALLLELADLRTNGGYFAFSADQCPEAGSTRLRRGRRDRRAVRVTAGAI